MLASSCPAWAQSGVTLYGVADANIEYVNHIGVLPTAANGFNPGPAKDVVRLNSGGFAGSRWGIRGVEDLGQGAKALFVLESGFRIDSGGLMQGDRLFGRQAYIGLKNAQYGQITLGRQYTSLFDGTADFYPAYYAPQYTPIALVLGSNNREDNTIKYTGVFGPLTAVAHYSFGTGTALPQTASTGVAIGGNGEIPGHARRDGAYGAALVYSKGPFSAMVSMDQFNPTIGPAANPSSGSFKKYAGAMGYNFSSGRIMGGYRWGQNKSPSRDTYLRDDYFWLGGIYQFTPAFSMTIQYDYDNVKTVAGHANTANPWQINLIANYTLSKRTDLYLSTAYAKNAGLTLDTSLLSYTTTLSLGNSYVPGNGASNMLGLSVGIRHTF
nr:porin [Cupriavidus numazuensis]